MYFMQSIDGGPIKIGTTIQLSVRLNQLKKPNGRELIILGIMDGGADEERAIHREFASLREDGEWFKPSTAILDFIASRCRAWDGEDESSMVRSVVSLKASQEFEEWLDEFVDFSGSGTRANAMKRAIKAFATEEKFPKPPPKR